MTDSTRRACFKAIAIVAIISGIFCELANTQLVNVAVAIVGWVLASIGILFVFLWIVDYLHELDARLEQIEDWLEESTRGKQ